MQEYDGGTVISPALMIQGHFWKQCSLHLSGNFLVFFSVYFCCSFGYLRIVSPFSAGHLLFIPFIVFHLFSMKVVLFLLKIKIKT